MAPPHRSNLAAWYVSRGTSKLLKIPSQGTGQRVTVDLVVFALTQVRRKATIPPWASWGHLTLAFMPSTPHTHPSIPVRFTRRSRSVIVKQRASRRTRNKPRVSRRHVTISIVSMGHESGFPTRFLDSNPVRRAATYLHDVSSRRIIPNDLHVSKWRRLVPMTAKEEQQRILTNAGIQRASEAGTASCIPNPD